MRFFLLIFLALLGRTLAADHFDPPTGLHFPDRLAGWVKISDKTYDDPRYGFSIGYRNPTGGTATLYVYSGAYTTIPSGADDPIIKHDLTAVLNAFPESWKERGGEVKSLLGISPLQNDETKGTFALVAAHSIHLKDGNHVSISALTGYHNRLLKLRFTYPGTEAEPGFKQLSGLISALLEINAEKLDPFFVPCLPKKTGK